MSFGEFAIRLRQTVQALNDSRENESILIAKELTALVRRRVQNEKVNSEGVPFGTYSPFWANVRANNNLPTDLKNYTFSGDMWRNTGPILVDNTAASTTVTIGGQTSRAAALLGFNSERDGDLIAPNEQEIQFVTEAHEERVFNILNDFL